MHVAELIAELEQEAGATRRVLERVPDERLAWRPHPRSDSLGQLALHVARIPGALAEVSLRDFDVGTPVPREQAVGVAELLAALQDSVERARAILVAMQDADLAAPSRLTRGDQVLLELPRGTFLRSVLFNHWYHHRGQLTVYLRLLDVPLPAVYGDSADDAGPLGG